MSDQVEIVLRGSSRASVMVALAHGAGAGMDSDFMEACTVGLVERGLRVARFEFPYMRRARLVGGRRPPDRAPVLIASWQEVIGRLRSRLNRGRKRLVIGGKSMGGRIASLVASENGVAGLVCLGYPFHPPGKPVGDRTKHLRSIDCPTLIVQGERDAFGSRAEVTRYRLSREIQWCWLQDGNHSWKPPKASSATLESNMKEGLDAIADFCQRLA